MYIVQLTENVPKITEPLKHGIYGEVVKSIYPLNKLFRILISDKSTPGDKPQKKLTELGSELGLLQKES